MTFQTVSAWISAQSVSTRDMIVVGVAFAVMCAVGLTLGVRFRALLLSWRFGPTLGVGIDAMLKDAEGEDAWVQDAEDAIDAAVRQHHTARPRALPPV
ncbi:hypothetical protein [Brevundimonas sp. SORGH_AS_0993]|uniref:hypothetical protein n=1 Tax=Brevundimonas sp. SORGH_AS_0993 TaxID=3041794 RepID=UPI00278A3E9B|nr:hypothetical protein [Brevundimonas sp. SORGH_AS_0993]MDQ1152844.1 hypothetical protein [Brevundimonas sp. SORGH_AS_0993]